ncbi:HpcH/HpaI aldolase/citrate lyase family protein [Nocardioides sp. 616]|uniref:HpcH/HpaI aldolase/citrate lyase family protein n=1 Tax=Nocardioides sp. 616 TaxID=2268090 RepID=UPI000CE30CEE|nr:HpcH/HpaI aldolase/citrate lyase family protein [Nocardioides sp. 616]
MRHFHQLSAAQGEQLFLRPPREFSRTADIDTMAAALGATLYMPATRPDLAGDLRRQGARGVLSSVVCLEDAISDDELPAAQANLIRQLTQAGQDGLGASDTLPLTFVRVRHPEQIAAVTQGLGEQTSMLSGFVLPKFTDVSGGDFLDALLAARAETGVDLRAMPVIESPEVIHRETRDSVLAGVASLLAKHRDVVLAVRLGATDLSSVYGLRRDRSLTVYDVRLVAEVITDVVNVLGRADGTGHVVTGTVWEYFAGADRIFKPLLRESPFLEHDAGRLRRQLITRDLDALIREVVLDKANGLIGKTVIHPTHVVAVHALSVVSSEEYSDACDITGQAQAGGGVRASSYRNKMNEAKPHLAWAQKTLRRADAFGVAHEDVTFVDFLAAAATQA